MRITRIGIFWSTITRTPFTSTISIRRQALPVRSPHTPQQLGQNPTVLVMLAAATKTKAWEFPQRREVADAARGPLLLSATSRCFSSCRGLQRMHTFVVW
jgi:hypothetical protein